MDGLAVTDDPVVPLLDELVDKPTPRVVIADALARVLATLTAKPGLMAWESVPLETFRPALPSTIQSCWIFVIRPGAVTGAERHPNSHQRSLTLCGSGRFELNENGVWHRRSQAPTRTKSLTSRWVSIPPATWHRLFSANHPWGMLSFHTVTATDLIEERPITEGDLRGPTTRRPYSADP